MNVKGTKFCINSLLILSICFTIIYISIITILTRNRSFPEWNTNNVKSSAQQYSNNIYTEWSNADENAFTKQFGDKYRSNKNWRNLSITEIHKLSELGKILYLDIKPPPSKPTVFKILIWNDGVRIKRRHIKRFGKFSFNPWENCLVSNCKISYNRSSLENANALLIPIQSLKSTKELPPQDSRNPKQIWIMLTDESPYHPFIGRSSNSLSEFNGFFNWTMTYRMDSDVPVPYGRTIMKWPLSIMNSTNIISIPDPSKKVHVVNLSSNCGGINGRWKYINELKKHIPVDILGGCGIKICPGHFWKDCDAIHGYTFYLAFENSNCAEYFTEKLWWNSYHNNLIPVIMGPSIQDCERLLPPHSYIHIDTFSSPKSLAVYLNYLINSPLDFNRYFEWKQNYRIVNEHGYFGSPSFHLCRICEALNFNSNQTKTYNNLNQFWNVNTDCRTDNHYQ